MVPNALFTLCLSVSLSSNAFSHRSRTQSSETPKQLNTSSQLESPRRKASMQVCPCGNVLMSQTDANTTQSYA